MEAVDGYECRTVPLPSMARMFGTEGVLKLLFLLYALALVLCTT